MSPPFLLDTCAAMYLVANEIMTPAAIDAMDRSADSGVPLSVSPITAWEIGMLAAKGRFKSSLAPQRWFERLRATAGIQLCDLPADVLMAASFLPGKIHSDPADRIITATAREYGFTLITRDRALLEYARNGHLNALEC
jgi:PIN domain nuclease of toxin-antitoxin system